MKKEDFKTEKIKEILNKVANGEAVKDICKKHGITTTVFRRWEAQHGGDKKCVVRVPHQSASAAPDVRDKFIAPGGHKPKTKTDFYNENASHFHTIVGYND